MDRSSSSPVHDRVFLFFSGFSTVQGDENDNDGDDDGDEDVEEDDEEEEQQKKKQEAQLAAGGAEAAAVISGQVYVNVSPPVGGRGVIGGGASSSSASASSSGSRPRSRSYDRTLDKSPSPRLGSLERMLSCPVRLSEGAAPTPPPPPRVTSFAEIARSKRRNGGAAGGGSPSMKSATAAGGGDPFSSTYSTHSHSSVDFSPILEQRAEADALSLSPVPFTRCYSQGSIEREARTKAEGTSPPTTHPPVTDPLTMPA